MDILDYETTKISKLPKLVQKICQERCLVVKERTKNIMDPYAVVISKVLDIFHAEI